MTSSPLGDASARQQPNPGISRLQDRHWDGLTAPGVATSRDGLPRRRTMKVFKTLLTLVLVVGVLGGAAYAGGRLLRDGHPRTVASSSDLPGAAGSSRPTGTSSPSSPTSPTSSPTHHAPVVK